MERIDQLKACLPKIPDIVAGLKKESENSFCGPCPKCGGEDRFVYKTDTERFWCRQCRLAESTPPGDIIDFHKWLHGLTTEDLFSRYLPGNKHEKKDINTPDKTSSKKRLAVQQFFDPVNIESITHYELGKPDNIYVYTCEQGVKHYLYVCRFDPKEDRKEKTFRQCRPDGKGGVIWSTKGVELVPYRLPELVKVEYCFMVEGERDVETLGCIGLVASCNPMGAGNWQDKLSKYFKGKKIAILPDNDKPGRSHAQQVANSLHCIAGSIKIVNLPDLPDKGDISDWFEAGHTKAELLSLAKQVKEWEPEGQAEYVNQDETETEEQNKWGKARELFPRVDYPWHILSEEIAESLKQLARSCASSPLSLPGAALSIFSSTLGSTIKVKSKKSWPEPLIFWFGDIRPSGEGKSPGPEQLKRCLVLSQKLADKDYKQRLEEELSKEPKDRRPVPRAKSFFFRRWPESKYARRHTAFCLEENFWRV